MRRRCVYLDHIAHRLSRDGATTPSGGMARLVAQLRVNKVLLRVHQADAAREQNNFQLALQLLKATREVRTNRLHPK